MRKMCRAAMATLAIALLSGCEPAEKETVHTVEAFGFHDVRLTGYRWLGCGRDDAFHEGFTATNQAGQQVSGIVCSGYFKGATVRLD